MPLWSVLHVPTQNIIAEFLSERAAEHCIDDLVEQNPGRGTEYEVVSDDEKED